MVWYYQAVAREVGGEQMAEYVESFGYGNADIGGEIDTFWLEGELRISAEEQIDFLRRFYHEDLPADPVNIDIVKDILIWEETLSYTISAKTGAALRTGDDSVIGWWVGYVESDVGVTYFALNISSDTVDDAFWSARIEIALDVLRELDIIENGGN